MMEGRNDNLNELAGQWLQAKAREEAANEHRLAIEARMLEMIDAKKEGSATVVLDDFKVTVTNKTIRSLDKGGAEAIAGLIPEEFQPLKTKVELDAQGLDWLKENRPKWYEAACRYITSKPAKPGFKVVRIEKVEAA